MNKVIILRISLLGLLLLTTLMIWGIAFAGNSANYSVNWQTLSGGGSPAESISGQITLNGTLGQSAIGTSSQGQVNLGLGYWYGVMLNKFRIILPLIFRNY